MHLTKLLTACVTVGACLALGCGSAPPPKEVVVEAPPEAPDPEVANPCDSMAIDPAENPCAGPAAAQAATEAAAAEVTPAAAEGDEDAAGDEAKSADGPVKKPAAAPGAGDAGETKAPEETPDTAGDGANSDG